MSPWWDSNARTNASSSIRIRRKEECVGASHKNLLCCKGSRQFKAMPLYLMWLAQHTHASNPDIAVAIACTSCQGYSIYGYFLFSVSLTQLVLNVVFSKFLFSSPDALGYPILCCISFRIGVGGVYVLRFQLPEPRRGEWRRLRGAHDLREAPSCVREVVESKTGVYRRIPWPLLFAVTHHCLLYHYSQLPRKIYLW